MQAKVNRVHSEAAGFLKWRTGLREQRHPACPSFLGGCTGFAETSKAILST